MVEYLLNISDGSQIKGNSGYNRKKWIQNQLLRLQPEI